MQINNTISLYAQQMAGPLFDTIGSKLAVAALIIISSIILAFAVDLVFKKVLLHYTAKTRFKIDDLVLKAVKRPIYYTLIFFGIFLALSVVGIGAYFLIVINNLLLTLLALIWLFALVNINKILFDNVFPGLVQKTETQMDDELLPLLKGLSDIIIIVVGIGMVLEGVWGINVGPLFASAGIVGIAIAFAAKDAISQFFGGLSIYYDKPFKNGDRIEIGDGQIGLVQEVGIRSTRILDFYNNMIIIPNSIIANNKIVNYTSPQPQMMVKIMIGVEYGSDVSKVKEVLLKIGNDIDLVLDDPKPSVRFDNHGDFSLDFALILWVKYPSEKFSVINDVNTLIDIEFKKAGIGIPFPTYTLLKPE
ncbi:mechanosensitive ion channel family protein [Methanococcoides alaskense]|uniref:MscS family membrane protein n=1 Tax=Methanococcoides alaskense TaxID=325778 RepID=A0AA90Z669_9EURY|nr:mechanosensitive ion channel family protein [Methanococcoides alaskense]MDA0525207.1 mechanosensitive ion channel family protein [Methanococcoides alaskense]MDR6221870.1 MscS family membrane protein [Methanococcoides alaskense]